LKNNLSSSNIAIIVLGVLLAVGLFFSAYKTNTKNAEQHSNHHGEAKTSESHDDDNVPTNLDEDVDLALANIEKGKSSGDMSLVMNEGIMKLLAVTKKDSNNIRAIYYLGFFSLESGQLQKAEKRFEKLISLQPQNEEYRNTLQEIRNQIGK
jgi:tetratricopeptide (TPR) repeat protein